MISEAEFTAILKSALPDAEIALYDTTGTQDHYRLWISTTAFEGKNLIEQHQLVYKVLDEALKDGRIHAVEIKTDVPKNSVST